MRAALEVFAELGFEAASTTEIARRAGVTQPLVHYHFENKERLWEAAVAETFSHLTALGDAAGAELEGLDGLPKLKAMVRRFVLFSAAHPEVARFLSREGRGDGARLRWLVSQHAGPLSATVSQLIRDASAAGLFKPIDPVALSCLLISAATHVFTVPALVRLEHGCDVRDPAVIARYADTLIEVFFHGVISEGQRGQP